jgi:hypothetical protein
MGSSDESARLATVCMCLRVTEQRDLLACG